MKHFLERKFPISAQKRHFQSFSQNFYTRQINLVDQKNVDKLFENYNSNTLTPNLTSVVLVEIRFCFSGATNYVSPFSGKCQIMVSNFLLSQFLETVLIFRPVKERDVNNPDKVNSRINKVRFAYRMYDLDNDGSISKDEILGVLVMMVGPHVDKEQLEEIAERAMREVG